LRLDTLTWMASYSPLVARPGIPIVDYLEMGKRGEDPRFYLSWYDAAWSTDPAFRDSSLSAERRANPSWEDDREAYLKQQKRRLPAAQYKRLHLNLPGPAKGAKFDPESVLAAVARGRKRLPYDETLEYFAAVDHSGGQNDAAVLAIGHRDPETERIILDVLQVVTSPHVPRSAINAFAETLKSFKVYVVWGDRYGGATFSHDYSARGINYRPLIVNKSTLYDALEPALASGDCEWLDIPELVDEALNLIEKNGKTDHPVGMFDDRVNAVAAMTYIARQREAEGVICIPFVADNTNFPQRDRWSPRWGEIYTPPTYDRDEFTGTLAWEREQRARRGGM
jgi:hypothetical protein